MRTLVLACFVACAACASEARPRVATKQRATPPTTAVADPAAEPSFTHDHHHGQEPTRLELRPIARVGIVEWSTRYPIATQELREWAEAYPDAMVMIAAWDAEESDQVAAFTSWAAARRYDVLDSFLARHFSWSWLARIANDPRGHEALEAYVAWARRNSDAAVELVAHPKGIYWAERNVVSPLTGRAR